MSNGVRGTEDLHSIKTRAIVLQNANNSFPAVNSVLALSDSHGHVTATRSINVNSIAINNDRAIIDASGNITANSILLDSSGTAIQTTGGDVYVTNANIYNSGDQNNTGTVETTYITLIDQLANNPYTYLWANNGSLLWQNDDLTENYNLSQGIEALTVDPNYRDFVLIQDLSDNNLYLTVNRLLQLFSLKQVFLDLSGSGPAPIPPPVSGLTAYSVIFNSKCGVIIRLINLAGKPVTGIGEFVFYGNANNGSTQFTISNLCNNLSNTTNSSGSILKDYVQFQYSLTQNPYAVTMTVADGYNVIFLDITRMGEAKRLMNHMLFTNQVFVGPTPPSNYPFGPPTQRQLVIPPYYPTYASQYIDYAITGNIVGRTFTSLLKYPNNDKALLSPTFHITANYTLLVVHVSVTAPPNTSGLTPPNVLQPGSGNVLENYGIYVNNTALWLQPYTGHTMTFDVPINNIILNDPGFNRFAITSIDVYNETIRPSFKLF